jgi:hypothetical protein
MTHPIADRPFIHSDLGPQQVREETCLNSQRQGGHGRMHCSERDGERMAGELRAGNNGSLSLSRSPSHLSSHRPAMPPSVLSPAAVRTPRASRSPRGRGHAWHGGEEMQCFCYSRTLTSQVIVDRLLPVDVRVRCCAPGSARARHRHDFGP